MSNGGRIIELQEEVERLRAIILDACEVLDHYALPEHAFHYRRVLKKQVPLNVPALDEQAAQ